MRHFNEDRSIAFIREMLRMGVNKPWSKTAQVNDNTGKASYQWNYSSNIVLNEYRNETGLRVYLFNLKTVDNVK